MRLRCKVLYSQLLISLADLSRIEANGGQECYIPGYPAVDNTHSLGVGTIPEIKRPRPTPVSKRRLDRSQTSQEHVTNV